MYEEPNEPNDEHDESAADPKTRANEKAEEFRMIAELAAVYEGPRKFDASLNPTLSADLAREVQRGIGKLEKAKTPDSPVLPETAAADAAAILNLFAVHNLPTNDYHIHRRPGEVMMVRWIAGDEVETFYQRSQAHFDAAMGGFREDERQALEWKNDPQISAYLDALDKTDVPMADRYLRKFIKEHNLYVLSTQAADEINIAYLADTLMGVAVEEIVGAASAPPEEPAESDLAWFFKLFSLRGMKDGVEQMCFFTYLQKSDDSF